MTKTQMFWKLQTMDNIALCDKSSPNRTLDGSKTCMKSDYKTEHGVFYHFMCTSKIEKSKWLNRAPKPSRYLI